MRRDFWRRIIVPAGAPDPLAARTAPEPFRSALPGDLSAWDFDGTFTVVPRNGAGRLTPAEWARCQEWARSTAAECTHTYDPLDWIQAQEHANAALEAGRDALALPWPVRAEVALTPAPGVEPIARDRHRDRLRQGQHGARYRALDESVFTDPRLTYLWWLEERPERLPDLDALETFLQAMKRGSEAAGGPRYAWIPLADRFVSRLDDADLEWLVKRLAEVFTSSRQPDLAAELRVRYPGAFDEPA